MKFPTGTQVTFPFEGRDMTGLVDGHQLGGGFVVVRCDTNPKHPLIAVREGLVKPVHP